jgi:hypothetical protein
VRQHDLDAFSNRVLSYRATQNDDCAGHEMIGGTPDTLTWGYSPGNGARGSGRVRSSRKSPSKREHPEGRETCEKSPSLRKLHRCLPASHKLGSFEPNEPTQL